jgi:hypothetical protein
MTGRLLARHERFVTRHALVYGGWAARHEPYSFLVYPLEAAIVPLIFWFVFGRGVALVLLVILEGLTIPITFFIWYTHRRALRALRRR